MMKKWMLGIALLSTSLFSQATLIESEVNSIDMAGIEVTAIFNDGSTDTQAWSAISSTLGGVSTSDWSLMLDGNTFGDFDSSTNTLYGEWILAVDSLSDLVLVGLTVDGDNAGIVFDIESGPLNSTPGSEAGRPFVASIGSATAAFTAPYSSPDLFGIMDVTGFELYAGDQLVFLTDTDQIKVPEPSTMFTFALGLVALTSLRKKSSGK